MTYHELSRLTASQNRILAITSTRMNAVAARSTTRIGNGAAAIAGATEAAASEREAVAHCRLAEAGYLYFNRKSQWLSARTSVLVRTSFSWVKSASA